MEKIKSYKVQDPSMAKYKSYKGNFKCGCGDEVDHDFISVHLNDCESMQNQYGELYNALNILIEDDPYMNTWNNVQALMAFFRRKLNKIIDEVGHLLKILKIWYLTF